MNKRPIVYINVEGTVFEVDIQNQQLIERANPINAISFVNQMIDHGTHYEMGYDRSLKTTLDRANDFSESENWELIKVPKLIELDPEGMADKYGYTVADLKDKTDFEIIVDQDLYQERKNGILPKIQIGENRYSIHLSSNALIASGHWAPDIDLEELRFNPDTRVYEGFYHLEKKQIVKIDPKLTEFPEHVAAITIPSMYDLDPVFMARVNNLNERDTLRWSPIRKGLEATLTHLSETQIPALIQKNRDQLQSEHQQNAHRIKCKRPRH